MDKRVLSPRQQEARTMNAVANLLAHRLVVPKIYFEPKYPNSRSKIDVLAIDRAGAGDIHAVEVNLGITNITQTIAALMEFPAAHFRYIAVFGSGNYKLSEGLLYAPDGLGRIGVIQVWEDDTDVLQTKIDVSPERFRLNPFYTRVLDKFVAKTSPDIEIRY